MDKESIIGIFIVIAGLVIAYLTTIDFSKTEVHVCTPDELAAEICTMEYDPVCGDNGVTYGNDCMACASGEITSYTPGECPA